MTTPQMIQSNNSNFGNVILNGVNGYWTMLDSMTVTSSMTITTGTLDTSGTNCGGTSCNITVGGSWITAPGGSFIAQQSSVTFTGSTPLKIQSRGNPFNYITLNGAGSWVLQDTMTVVSTVTLTQGLLNGNGKDITAFHHSVGDLLDLRGVALEVPEATKEPSMFTRFDRYNWLTFAAHDTDEKKEATPPATPPAPPAASRPLPASPRTEASSRSTTETVRGPGPPACQGRR